MFVQIIGLSLVASAIVPIVMLTQPPKVARQVFHWAMLPILSTMATSCWLFVSQGEYGFLSNSQGILMGSIFLAISLGLGYAASRVKANWLARHRDEKPKLREPGIVIAIGSEDETP